MGSGSHRRESRRWSGRAALAVGALLAAACGGASADSVDSSSGSDGSSPIAADTLTSDTTPTDAAATEASPAGTVEDAAPSVVKVITEGSPLDPFSDNGELIGQIGSGFIVDPGGLVVATFHSMAQYDEVTAYLRDSDEPIEGTVVAVSECNDLVLIDLPGDEYPFLDWRSESIDPGLEVFAAGYPLNLDTDPLEADYTLTAGIVNTAGRSSADTWVAVDGVIEHDARIRGGSSGGPLLDETGAVVGVNFAGDDENDLNSAIAAPVAAEVVARLVNGDVESIGIDGEAASDGIIGGVWVSGVRPDTPAEAVGLLAGDLITSLGGEDLGSDPTMQTFCEVLRSPGTPDGLDLEVLRTPTGEVLTGTLGGAVLAGKPSRNTPIGTGADSSSGDDPSGDDSPGDGTVAYEFVADESESIGVEVPVTWDERDGSPNPSFGPSLFAAPDLDGFQSTWNVPGLIIEFDPDGGVDDLDLVLDGLFNDQCTSLGRVDFTTDDGVFAGRSETLDGCGGTDTQLLNVAATRPDGRTLIRLQVQTVDEEDRIVAERAVATFDAVLAE